MTTADRDDTLALFSASRDIDLRETADFCRRAEAMVIVDHYKDGDAHWLAPFECDPAAQDCRLIEYDDAPVLYTDDPNVERVA